MVFAQLSGATYWLALPRYELVDEVVSFAKQCHQSEWPESFNKEMRSELIALCQDKEALANELETFANTSLIHCMNETPAFVQQLVHRGHGQFLNRGDVILLPQAELTNCCWHTVFCVGNETGQALSFAIRTEQK